VNVPCSIVRLNVGVVKLVRHNEACLTDGHHSSIGDDCVCCSDVSKAASVCAFKKLRHEGHAQLTIHDQASTRYRPRCSMVRRYCFAVPRSTSPVLTMTSSNAAITSCGILLADPET
jgi:hypothetical protein